MHVGVEFSNNWSQSNQEVYVSGLCVKFIKKSHMFVKTLKKTALLNFGPFGRSKWDIAKNITE